VNIIESSVRISPCLCGCLGIPNSGNKYIHGHNNARFGTGKPVSPPQLCACGVCGLITNPGSKYIHGHNKGNKDKKASKEKLKNQSNASKKVWEREGFREKHHKSMMTAWESIELREKHSKIQKIVKNRPKERERNSQKITKLWQDSKYREQVIKSHKITENLPEVKLRKSQSQKALWKRRPELKKKMSSIQKEVMSRFWKDSANKEKRLSAIGKGMKIHPNKPETVVLNLLSKMYPNEWKYTGDFSFMIGGKNPDFVNINGQKKCIELFGDYWHKDQNPQDRINIFKEFGWDTLVIWESELKDIEKVKEKLFSYNKL
jgi:hypothetical protein